MLPTKWPTMGSLALMLSTLARHLFTMMRRAPGESIGSAAMFAGRRLIGQRMTPYSCREMVWRCGTVSKAAVEAFLRPSYNPPMHYARLVVYLVVFVLWHSPESLGANFRKGYDAAVLGDYDVALREWRQLAEEGDALAQAYLGVMYANGHAGHIIFADAIPRDNAAATRWFRRAAEQNYVGARDYLDEIRLYEERHRLAIQGDRIAQSNLGTMYATGFAKCSWCAFRVIPQNFVKAADWYRQAAKQQESSAQFDLATMYQKGQGVPRDIAEAIRWYGRAAEAGYANAQFNLGLIHAMGDGVVRNPDLAEHWLYRAARRGNANAWLLFGALRVFRTAPPHPYLPGHAVRRTLHRSSDRMGRQMQ